MSIKSTGSGDHQKYDPLAKIDTKDLGKFVSPTGNIKESIGVKWERIKHFFQTAEWANNQAVYKSISSRVSNITQPTKPSSGERLLAGTISKTSVENAKNNLEKAKTVYDKLQKGVVSGFFSKNIDLQNLKQNIEGVQKSIDEQDIKEKKETMDGELIQLNDYYKVSPLLNSATDRRFVQLLNNGNDDRIKLREIKQYYVSEKTRLGEMSQKDETAMQTIDNQIRSATELENKIAEWQIDVANKKISEIEKAYPSTRLSGTNEEKVKIEKDKSNLEAIVQWCEDSRKMDKSSMLLSSSNNLHAQIDEIEAKAKTSLENVNEEEKAHTNKGNENTIKYYERKKPELLAQIADLEKEREGDYTSTHSKMAKRKILELETELINLEEEQKNWLTILEIKMNPRKDEQKDQAIKYKNELLERIKDLEIQKSGEFPSYSALKRDLLREQINELELNLERLEKARKELNL